MFINSFSLSPRQSAIYPCYGFYEHSRISFKHVNDVHPGILDTENEESSFYSSFTGPTVTLRSNPKKICGVF